MQNGYLLERVVLCLCCILNQYSFLSGLQRGARSLDYLIMMLEFHDDLPGMQYVTHDCLDPQGWLNQVEATYRMASSRSI